MKKSTVIGLVLWGAIIVSVAIEQQVDVFTATWMLIATFVRSAGEVATALWIIAMTEIEPGFYVWHIIAGVAVFYTGTFALIGFVYLYWWLRYGEAKRPPPKPPKRARTWLGRNIEPHQ